MRTLKTFFLILFVLASCAGCSSHEPVRHLSTDACLIIPKLSNRQEVTSFLGIPDERLKGSDNSEIWYYFQPSKTFWRKTPLIGKKMGEENYDLVTVTFVGERVSTCVYRELTEEEFKKSGIQTIAPKQDQ